MKKKILTLTFTLILLIGLVAALGMNASAAPSSDRQLVSASSTAELENALAGATDGTTIRLTSNITTDQALTQNRFEDRGTVVLDLNGYHVTAANGNMEYLIKVGKNTSLHVVNSDLSRTSIINYDSGYTSGMFLIGGKGAELHLYKNILLRAGYDDNHAKKALDLSIVKITEGSKLYISGTVLQNRMFNGVGISFNNRGSNPFDNFTLKIEGGAKISAKVACIAYYGNYPGNSDVNVCDLYYDDTKIGGDSGSPIGNFKALYYDGSDETFTLDDVITGDSKMQYADSIGTLNSYTKIKFFPTGDEYNVMKIENPAAKHVCTPEPNIIFLKNNVCYHWLNCKICGDAIIFDKCTTVGRIEAKCSEDGQTAGYKCPCGNVTSEAIPATGVHTYENACDTECNVCKGIRTITHTGGTATCKAKAVCTVCKQAYGSLNANNHKIVTIPAKAATYKATGLTEGKKCADCGTVTVPQNTVAKKVLAKVKGLKVKAVKLASGTKTTLTLAWTKVADAEKYEVYQQSGKKWKKIGTTSKTTLTVKKLKANKSYKFKVRAIRSDAQGAYSTVFTGKTVPLKTTLTLKAGKKALTASWKTVANITGYEVQVSTSKKFTSKTTKKVTIKKAKTKKTTIKKLSKGKKYYVKVRAYKTVGSKKIYSAWSSVKTVKVK